ncbi:uncharacterized protein LOC116005032 [Ipomoea triloba]|uniref:uncharacterized protein LOC116005032 n=1 Tax=Ipomoea triloba TaxID=35885 RepID=UPI00125D1450|nr:uncharacterized protein LOC116005032 [Ipomoea triloba]
MSSLIHQSPLFPLPPPSRHGILFPSLSPLQPSSTAFAVVELSPLLPSSCLFCRRRAVSPAAVVNRHVHYHPIDEINGTGATFIEVLAAEEGLGILEGDFLELDDLLCPLLGID